MKKKEILEVFERGDYMSLSLKERRAVVKEVSKRYKKASKKEKGKILDEFVKLTGYNRCYASYLLRMYEKKVVAYGKDGIRNVFIANNGYKGRKVKVKKKKEYVIRKRNRKRIYGEDVLNALIYLWELSDFICGKRLVYYIREVLPHLKKKGSLRINKETEEKLLKISAASIDRLLKKEKEKYRLIKRRGLSHTKPGTLLKYSIPIRT